MSIVFLYPCIIVIDNYRVDNLANHCIYDVYGIVVDYLPDDNDSERPNSISKRKWFYVKKKQRNFGSVKLFYEKMMRLRDKRELASARSVEINIYVMALQIC